VLKDRRRVQMTRVHLLRRHRVGWSRRLLPSRARSRLEGRLHVLRQDLHCQTSRVADYGHC
jgi:hypothetical protein